MQPEQQLDPDEQEHLRREAETAREDFIRELDESVRHDGGELTEQERARALEMTEHEGIHDLDVIKERLFLESGDTAIDSGATNGAEPAAIPGWDDAYHGGTQTEGGVVPAVPGPEGAAGGGIGGTGGEGAREEAEYFQRRKSPTDLIAEREAEGQLGLLGTERISQGELAQRKANEPLRPSVEQKPADEGLFGTEKDQRELFQKAQGKVRIREGLKPVITLFEQRDASTAIHELGHVWLEEMMQHSELEQAPDILKTDAKTIKDWLGVETANDIKTSHHEKFARGFEQYMREGVAPSPGLANVFAKFRDWMLRIYQTLKGLGPEIPPQIRDVFDRMLALEPQRTVIAPERMVPPTLADIHEADAKTIEPQEAEAAGDRVLSEANRFLSDLPAEITNAHAATTAKIAEAAAAEPAAETPGVAGQPSAVEPSGGGPGTTAPGGAGSAEPGAELRGGGGPVRESAEPSGAGERPGSAGEPDAALGDKPLAPRPKLQFGAKESPFTDKAGNIRLENLTNVEEVRQAIRDAADENEDFIGDRRGIVTDGQVMDLAADLGLEGAERLVKERVIGQAFNAEQVVALRKLLIQSATELSAAMKKAAAGTDEDVIAYAVAKDRHQMIQATVAQATAEAGRALRAFRNIAGETTAEAAQADMFVRQATGKTLFQLRQEAKLGSSLDTPQKISKFMQDASKRSFGRMLLGILDQWADLRTIHPYDLHDRQRNSGVAESRARRPPPRLVLAR